MQITSYGDIDALLRSLLDRIRRILDKNLVGVYLYGSLVTGDFDRDISDIDLLAVTSADIEDREFAQLEKMHNDCVRNNREWEDRIEIAYLSAAVLTTYRSGVSQIAVISPGEPFHVKEAGKDWLINWWVVREKGVPLFGPSPTTLIDPISREEFLQAVQEQAKDWKEWVYHGRERKAQAYAILTLCRALYAAKNGEQVSKRQAALWVQKQLPQWAALIRRALGWREAWREENVDHAATFPETVRFVHFVIDQMGLEEAQRHLRGR